MAASLTKMMKKYIKAEYGEERSKQYSIRSTRKAAMTENRVQRDLYTQEEYARSGHTAPDQNTNAEGYVETSAAMSAPGGKALAGYLDPHAAAHPMSFSCLQCRASQSLLDAFLSNLFVNDIECLQPDGMLREMLVACAAALLGWCNDLERDVGGSNAIVNKIRMAAQKSAIKDSAITATVGAPMWLLTLKYWSKILLMQM